MSTYQAWNVEQAAAIIASHLGRDGAMLPILHELQATFGCISKAAVPMVAEALNVTRAEVHGVVTFYHDFRPQPPGRHVLKLCRARGADSVPQAADAAHLCALRHGRPALS